VLEVHVIGRTNHQQVEIAIVDQRFEAVILLADGNAVLFRIGEAGRGRIDITDDLEITPGSSKNPRQISKR
jgi:hypothetical protein